MKLLVFLTRFPYPLNKGDKLRAFYQIKELQKKHDVYLFCLTDKTPKDEHINIVKDICKDVYIEKFSSAKRLLSITKALFSDIPFQVAFFTTKKSKQHFLFYHNKIKPDCTYFQFVRSAEYAKQIKGNKVLDYQDCLSMNMLRRSKVSHFPFNILFKKEAERLQDYEKQMFDIFNNLTIITAQDRDYIASNRKDEIKVIENGVDEKFFTYKRICDKKFDIIFSGNMAYKPNVVAAKWLVDNIMPLVWERKPQTTVVLAGSNPKKEIKNLAKKYNSKVFVSGWVDDMRDYYACSKIFVAPMQIGTGLQNKLLEAMAMNLPCLTTPLANVAIGAKEDEQILVGNNEKQLAEKILLLLDNQTLSKQIATQGNSFVKENYNWGKSMEKIEKLL